MKKMIIFEKAMCCSTGVCGPSVDQELLRVSTVVNNFKNKGVTIERYNLSSNPQEFVDNIDISKMIDNKGLEVLPITTVDGVVVKTEQYPSNEQFCSFLEVDESYISSEKKEEPKKCGCKGGCC